MRTFVIALGMLLVGLTGAQASGCGTLSTQAAMNKCADKAYKSSDRRMNRVYRVAMKAQSGDHRQALRKAQRSWVVFRNNACKSYSNLGDAGSMRPLLFSDCLAQLTLERTKMLQLQTLKF